MPIGKACSRFCGLEASGRLPERGPLGSREATLHSLAKAARLVYGAGFIDKELWGKFDPPLNGEGWEACFQICETSQSRDVVQAACYRRTDVPGVAVVSFRGTVSKRGLEQCFSLLHGGIAIRNAVEEARGFFMECRQKLPGWHLYVVGHSLGGYFAEAVASRHGAEGAAFNSPGPWRWHSLGRVAGRLRPPFEVHLTYGDPLAAVVFPKPENSCHIAWPIWHEGSNHRICEPYMCEVEDMSGVTPNNLKFLGGSVVDQADWLELR